MNRIDCFNALDLDHNDITDDQVNTIPKVDLLSFVNQRQSDLTGDGEALFALMQQAGVVSAFEESGPKDGVDFHRGGDDLTCDVVNSRSYFLRYGRHLRILLIASPLLNIRGDQSKCAPKYESQCQSEFDLVKVKPGQEPNC